MISEKNALECWLRERSPESRDRLIGTYGYLLARGARKFYRAGLERADLEQIAAIGLIKACDRYDGRLKTPFEAFAWLLIVGELMHYVRDHERIVRPPRRMRRLDRLFSEAAEQLVVELGRMPSPHEISSRAGVSERELAEVALYRELALPESLETVEPHRLGPQSYTIEDREDRILLDAALAHLTKTERTIIFALYGTGHSQYELARHLGYSRRHISRLHRGAIDKMRPFFLGPQNRAAGHFPKRRERPQEMLMKNERGFTLLEMMVVVAIIAILAGILIPNFTRARAQAATSACMANEKTIATALELYYTDNQKYPPSASVDSTFVKTMSGYMNQIPIDPTAGAGAYYKYVLNSSGGVVSYNITCPGTHDPATLMALTGGASTTDTKILYDSQNGFAASP